LGYPKDPSERQFPLTPALSPRRGRTRRWERQFPFTPSFAEPTDGRPALSPRRGSQRATGRKKPVFTVQEPKSGPRFALQIADFGHDNEDLESTAAGRRAAGAPVARFLRVQLCQSSAGCAFPRAGRERRYPAL